MGAVRQSQIQRLPVAGLSSEVIGLEIEALEPPVDLRGSLAHDAGHRGDVPLARLEVRDEKRAHAFVFLCGTIVAATKCGSPRTERGCIRTST